MNIHHSIVKSAATKGIALTVEDDAIVATHTETGVRGVRLFEHMESEEDQSELNDMARDAWNDAQEIVDYQKDQPAIRISFDEGDYIAMRGDNELARDPVLEDLFLTLQDMPEEEIDGEDEEDDKGSVVPPKYKARYAEAGHPTHCGDWLAETINSLCRVKDEKGKETTDLDRLETIANANDVAPGRYGKLGVMSNGWQGRFRMTVRNMLTPLVAKKGFLFVPDGEGVEGDQELQAPDEWRAAHTAKGKPERVVSKDPGAGKASAKTAAKKGGKSKAKDVLEEGLKAASDALKSSKAKEEARTSA